MSKLTGVYLYPKTGVTWTVMGGRMRSSKGAIIKINEEYERMFNSKDWVHLDFNTYYEKTSR